MVLVNCCNREVWTFWFRDLARAMWTTRTKENFNGQRRGQRRPFSTKRSRRGACRNGAQYTEYFLRKYVVFIFYYVHFIKKHAETCLKKVPKTVSFGIVFTVSFFRNDRIVWYRFRYRFSEMTVSFGIVFGIVFQEWPYRFRYRSVSFFKNDRIVFGIVRYRFSEMTVSFCVEIGIVFQKWPYRFVSKSVSFGIVFADIENWGWHSGTPVISH